MSAKGHNALHLSRELNVQYKTSFVLAHKLREAIAAEAKHQTLWGEVEIDGAYFGGYVKPANWRKNRRDRRLARNQSGKRRVVVAMRQRGGRTIASVHYSEEMAIPVARDRVHAGSVLLADEALSWEALHAHFKTVRINHSEAYSDMDGNTNHAESYFSRLRRAEIGTHHHISGPYLGAYASEMAWREDFRRKNSDEQRRSIIKYSLRHPVSNKWAGYWQRARRHRSG
jgi:hypothetical protein